MSIEKQALKLRSHVDEGLLRIVGAHFGPVDCELSGLSMSPAHRSVFEDCSFANVRVRKCTVGFPVFRRCVFDGLRADCLACYGAAFVACRFSGLISGVNLGVDPGALPISPSQARELYAENERLQQACPFAIDVREAVLSDVGFVGPEIARRVLFHPGQCIIYRGSDLQLKLRRALQETADPGLQMALLPPVSPDHDLHLVALERGGSGERLPEIRRIVAAAGVEMIEESMVRV